MNEEALELSAKFLSIDPIESPETSRSASLHFLMDSDSELDSQEYKEMFKKMCDDYESLRLRGQNEGLSENDFMERLGKPSSCFVANPDLFLEVHELWCDDFRRASMYRVDPFQKALVLLRSHLNPIIPEDFKKRKQLRREILGPLKSPQVIFGAAPFEIAISPKHEKTSLKKQQAASASRNNGVCTPQGKALTPHLDNTAISKNSPSATKKTNPFTWDASASPRKVESKSPLSGGSVLGFFGRKNKKPDGI